MPTVQLHLAIGSHARSKRPTMPYGRGTVRCYTGNVRRTPSDTPKRLPRGSAAPRGQVFLTGYIYCDVDMSRRI